MFTDYGEQVTYTCVGPQVSRNSKCVLNNPPFMDNLPIVHWESLVWLIKRTERCFSNLADHQVISHLYHAKKAVPFKTFSSTACKSPTFSSEYFGGIAFVTNVFLHCHTDADFTMSITQVFLKGQSEYHLNDGVVAYFYFPTLGVAVQLRPGDYIIFNVLIPHCISSRVASWMMRSCVSLFI